MEIQDRKLSAADIVKPHSMTMTWGSPFEALTVPSLIVRGRPLATTVLYTTVCTV